MNTIQPKESAINHEVVSQQEWIEASQKLLVKEKEWTRAKDELSRMRRELPWVKVEKEYAFDGPNGKETLSDLFAGKNQLIVYHFMYAPDWNEGCDGCTFISDHFDGANWHLPHHNISLVAISRAPLEKLEAYKKRMGWNFKWVSSGDGDFPYDFQASFRQEDLDRGPVFYNFKEQKLRSQDQPGMSVFYKDAEGQIFHTYSSYERGGDLFVGAYNFIDITPLGRAEGENIMGGWMKRHDQY